MKYIKIFTLIGAAVAVWLMWKGQGSLDSATTRGSKAEIQGKNEQGAALSPRAGAVPTTAVGDSSAPTGQVVALPAPSPATQVRQGTQLAQLHRQLNALPVVPAKDQYLSYKISQWCGLVSGRDEANFVHQNDATRPMALAAIKMVRESCGGLDVSLPAQKNALEQKRKAAEKGDPYAVGESLLALSAQGLGADAFGTAKGLLIEHPDDPQVWELALTALGGMGIRIGQDDEVLKQFTATQMDAALMLVLCEQTGSCQFQKSAFLQSECIVGGRCADSAQSYIAEYVLPPSEFSALGTASARLTSLLSGHRWDLLGFTSTNQPKQARPSVLPKKP